MKTEIEKLKTELAAANANLIKASFVNKCQGDIIDEQAKLIADANKRADEWKRMADELADKVNLLKEVLSGKGIEIRIYEITAELDYGSACSQIDQALSKFDQMKGKL